MKKEHIMQNAPSGRHRLIHASVASALALISISVQANTQQFAQTPFYLQNKTDVSGQPKVKHNIMFLLMTRAVCNGMCKVRKHLYGLIKE